MRDRHAIELDDSGFEMGSLRHKSNIRPNRLFTCDVRSILYQAGRLKLNKIEEAIERVVQILRS